MQIIGTIVDFAADGKAVVEFEKELPAAVLGGSNLPAGNEQNAPAEARGDAHGSVRRLALEVIPGVAKGTQVYVEVKGGSLLQMPMLAYVMAGAFAAGMLAGLAVLGLIMGFSKAVLPSLMLGLLCAAGAIVAINVREARMAREEFRPRIVGAVWKK